MRFDCDWSSDVCSSEVVSCEVGEQGQRDFKTQISKANREGVEAFYLVGYAPELGYMVRQIRELGINIKLLSCQPMEDPQVREIAKEALEGVIFTTTTINPNDPEADVGKDFYYKFKEKYKKEPGSYAPESY